MRWERMGRESNAQDAKKGTYHEELDGGESSTDTGVVRDLALLVERHCEGEDEGEGRGGSHETHGRVDWVCPQHIHVPLKSTRTKTRWPLRSVLLARLLRVSLPVGKGDVWACGSVILFQKGLALGWGWETGWVMEQARRTRHGDEVGGGFERLLAC